MLPNSFFRWFLRATCILGGGHRTAATSGSTLKVHSPGNWTMPWNTYIHSLLIDCLGLLFSHLRYSPNMLCSLEQVVHYSPQHRMYTYCMCPTCLCVCILSWVRLLLLMDTHHVWVLSGVLASVLNSLTNKFSILRFYLSVPVTIVWSSPSSINRFYHIIFFFFKNVNQH